MNQGKHALEPSFDASNTFQNYIFDDPVIHFQYREVLKLFETVSEN